MIGEFNLDLVADPLVEPATVAEVKQWLRLEIAEDDAIVAGLIPAARRHLENSARVSLLTRTYRLRFDRPESPFAPVRLPMGPVQSVQSVRYYSAGVPTDWDSADWGLNPGRFACVGPATGGSWPTADDRPGAYEVVYTAGFGDSTDDVPSGILCVFRLALQLVVAAWYENREEFGPVALTAIPTGAARLLDSIRDRSRY